MVRGIKRLRYRRWMWSGIASLILFCTFCLTACGVPAPPAHPLSNDDTSITVTGNTASPTSVRPIQVETSLSDLVTYPGGLMNMTIATNPHALCSFIIAYGLGTPSRNAGIAPVTADDNGLARWTWRVDGDARTGWWPLTITAVLPNGAKTTSQVSVHITFPPISIVSTQTNLTAPPRSMMTLTIATAPDISCVLIFNDGPGRPTKALRANSNTSGIANWMWRVDNAAVVGSWPISINVTLLDGETTSTQAHMTIS